MSDPVPAEKDETSPQAPVAGIYTSRVTRLIATARGRALGLLVLALGLIALVISNQEHTDLRLDLFDFYQQISPRERQAAPAVIVAIDEKSLTELGQWPWPRSYMAGIVENITNAGALVIGIDAVFPDADRLSPGRFADGQLDMPSGVKERLHALPDTDETFARALSQSRVVMALAGMSDSEEKIGRLRPPPVFMKGSNKTDKLLNFPGFVQTRPEILKGAASLGVINAATEIDGVIRRLPMIAQVDGKPVPAITMEMWRQVTGEPAATFLADDSGFHTAQIGGLDIPLQDDGTMFVPFGRSRPDIYISASDVLAGRIPADFFAGKLALIGVSALGLGDRALTPLFEKIPGVEVHAQIIEAVFTQTYLSRPRWAFPAEFALMTVLSLVLIILMPMTATRWLIAIVIVTTPVVVGVGIAHHMHLGLLIDIASPLVGVAATGLAMLASGIVIAQARRRALEADLQMQREARARIDGELAAATRIQLGLLPDHNNLENDSRYDLAAFLEPAREVGGDLYDFFMIDENRLFFAVGDVSGKGVGASLFMAISKALYKSSVLRGLTDIDEITAAANDEIARDNPEMLFVTLFAGILDLNTGVLEFCNAGHDLPQLYGPNTSPENIVSLEEGGGPPLCVMEGFPYMAASTQMKPGDTLVVTTDGIGEAMNHDGELYGSERLLATLSKASEGPDDPDPVIRNVYDDVKRHADGAPPSDDLTLLVVRWNGAA